MPPSPSTGPVRSQPALVHKQHMLPINHLIKYVHWACFQHSPRNRLLPPAQLGPTITVLPAFIWRWKEEKSSSKMESTGEGSESWPKGQVGTERAGSSKGSPSVKKEVTGREEPPGLGECPDSQTHKQIESHMHTYTERENFCIPSFVKIYTEDPVNACLLRHTSKIPPSILFPFTDVTAHSIYFQPNCRVSFHIFIYYCLAKSML